MVQPFVSAQDGPRVTVNSLMKNPLTIPRRMLRMTEQQFLVDAVLRNAGANGAGAVAYEESTPLFAEGEAEVVEEFGEIPATTGSRGIPRVARAVKRALALKVSQEMRDENKVDAVNTQMTQIRNTFVRTWEDAFWSMIINNPSIPTMPASGVWGDSATRVRDDIAEGIYTISEAETEDQDDNFLGFEADTLIISNRTATDFLKNDDIAKVFVGNIADENPQYKGTMPGNFYGLRVMKSRRLDPTRALLLQRNVIGGISDTRPMRATPLYEDRPRETWRSDLSRKSAMFLDQPKAAVLIEGVSA